MKIHELNGSPNCRVRVTMQYVDSPVLVFSGHQRFLSDCPRPCRRFRRKAEQQGEQHRHPWFARVFFGSRIMKQHERED